MKRRQKESESRLQWTIEVVATALFWGLWAYFITPVLSIVLWYLGFQVFVEEMFELGGFEALQEQLRNYGLVIFSIFLVTASWVTYNRLRYGGSHNTRTHMLAPVDVAETAAAAGIKVAQAAAARRSRRLVVTFDSVDRMLVRTKRAPSKAGGRRVSLRRDVRKA